jgi:ubiquinone/menaquinone biosynthesis C-methylase UbiE
VRILRDPPPELAATYSGAPFAAYAESLDVNWSDDLESLHEESSRDHFLDVWTRTAMLDSLLEWLTPKRAPVVLDAGCSSGYLLEDLRAAYPNAQLIGADLVAAGLFRASENVPDAELILSDVCDLPLADQSVDAIVSANLLEHVPDDIGALQEFRRVLKPGGLAAIVIPAGPGLYDYYDGFLGHERRYGLRELSRKATSAGLEVKRDAFLGSFIYPPFWIIKKLNRRRHIGLTDDQAREMVSTNIDRTMDSKLGAAACAVERALLRHGVGLPFGIRGLTVVRRPI